jgi:NTE family protein
MGLDTLVNSVDVVLACDAGAHLELTARPFEDDILQFRRIRDLLIEQTRALRKRWLTCDLEAGRRHGAYWGIDSRMDDFPASGTLTADNAKTARLMSLPIRLGVVDARDQGRLINWGYALADAAVRCRPELAGGPAPAWPLPEWHLS